MAIRGTPTLSYWQKKFSNSILSIYENEIAIDENFLKVAHIPYHLFSRHEGKALIAHLARFTLDSGNFSFKDPSDLWRNCSKKSLKNSNSFFGCGIFENKKSWSTIWSCWTYNNYWRWKWWNNAENKPGIYIGFPPCAHLEIEIIFTIFSANVHSTLWKFQSHLPAYPPPGDSRWSKFQYQVQIFGQKYYIRRSDRHSFTTCSYWICSRIKKISSVPNSFSFWIFSKMSDLARQCQKESGDFSDSDSIIVSSFNIYGLTDGSISTKNL